MGVSLGFQTDLQIADFIKACLLPQDSAGEVVSRCPSNCLDALAMTNDEVDLMRHIPNAVQRNIGITYACQAIGRQMPNN